MPDILGIKISDFNHQEALDAIKKWLHSGKTGYAVTPNPEIILHALKDESFKKILNEADFSFADGFGLKLAGLYKGEKIKRVTGSDLSPEILKLAEKKNYKVTIIIWNKGLSSKEELENALKERYKNLQFKIIISERSENLATLSLSEINEYEPTILFVALGFPEQEKMIYNYLPEMSSVRFAIGVGGTFDFITKKATRAPQLMRRLGLEWLWRLILQPRRIKRILRATFLFIYKVISRERKKGE